MNTKKLEPYSYNRSIKEEPLLDPEAEKKRQQSIKEVKEFKKK